MANCIAKAMGVDKSRTKTTHRLGSEKAYVEANTWQTFASACVLKDGTARVTIRRGQKLIHEFDFDEPE